MPAITVTDLNNAKTDVDHIATIATSAALTATDRLGNVKNTLAGAVATIAAITNRGAWATATVYASKDIVSNSGDWYICVVPHTSAGLFATDAANWRVYQGVIAADLASTANGKGASTVGVEDAAGNFTATNVEGALAELAADISAGSDASLVSYSPASGSAVTVQTALRELQAGRLISITDAPYSASTSNTDAQNKTALQAAITAVDVAGGGTVIVPSLIDYGYNTRDLATYPSFAGLTNDIIVLDYGYGTADGTNKAGAQCRVFFGNAQTTPAGQHDGNGYWASGDWHPYFSLNNTANNAAVGDPSRAATDNRRLSLLFNNDGKTTWRFGQGTVAGAGYTDAELSNFVLEHYAQTGDTLADYAPLIIERNTGNWAFGSGTNAPPASYQFKSRTAGYDQGMFESLSTTCTLTLRNSTGASADVAIRNVAGALQLYDTNQGVIAQASVSTRHFGIGVVPAYRLDVADSQSGGFVSNIKNTNATNGNVQIMDSTSAAGTGWFFQRMFSSDQSQQAFYFRGDGNAAADGAFTGGGADRAEAFEWADGNPEGIDGDKRDVGSNRVGYTVTVEDGKIRIAKKGDNVLGVVSLTHDSLGNANPLNWNSKYLRDDFGAYLFEDDPDNEGGKRRKLNPDYDPARKYIPRMERREWDAIGLLGLCRVRKGQPVGANWIKMRDISETVQEWLVR